MNFQCGVARVREDIGCARDAYKSKGYFQYIRYASVCRVITNELLIPGNNLVVITPNCCIAILMT